MEVEKIVILFSRALNFDKKHKNPKNLASGIGYGGVAFAKGLFRGLTGIVYEPYKGAKKKGIKGFG